MAYHLQSGGYVKFMRGTPTTWPLIETKDNDTLYFIVNLYILCYNSILDKNSYLGGIFFGKFKSLLHIFRWNNKANIKFTTS